MFIFGMLCACVASIAPLCQGEMFTSMAHLEHALWAEGEIATAMKDYIREEEQRLNRLKSIATQLEEHSNTAKDNPHFYLGNPVNAYLFVKRFTVDWDRDIADELTTKTVPDLDERIDHFKKSLPTYEDLNGAVSALLRLQDTYQLDTDRIARGDLGGAKSTELTASDCFELGRVAYNDEDFYHTSLWMEEALTKCGQQKNITVDRQEILDYLAFSVFKQGNVRYALDLTNELLTIVPDHSRAKNNKAYYQRMLNDLEQKQKQRGDTGDSMETQTPIFRNERKLDEYRNSEEFLTYERLCRGEETQKYKYKHRLVCRLRNNKHPLLWLNPAREEEIYLKPYLVFYHDVVTDNEIEVIKYLATPRLGRATVHNSVTGKLETATYRISKSAWLKAEDHVVISRVNNRIEAVTGLDMNTAEDLQIANYGLGGHYEPHFDFARRDEPEAFKSLGTGNRIATWLTYMSSVEAGGATVFPYLGVKIFPEKGGAAFWYNLFKSGEGIYDTRHAACPVLVGTKWVSNKWIHERGQEFRRPCGLDADQ